MGEESPDKRGDDPMGSRKGAIVVLAAILGLAGCGGGPKLVPVSGTVTLNGKPMKDAEILFLPDPSSKDGLPAQDQTGPEGNYKVMTLGRAGVVPGKYKVVVTLSTVDASKIPGSFKDDPYMGKLVVEGPAPATGAPAPAARKPTEIKGEFEREVEPAGGILDFDVKAEIPKP
jgi:hypothetical protein